MKKILLFLFCLLPNLSFALSSDNNKPADLVADSAVLNHNSGIGIYRGHVILTQGTTIIKADVLTTYLDQHHQLIKAIAVGTPTNLASYSTLPDNNKLPFSAIALTINYFPPRNWIEFIGQAKATQGQDNFSGPKLTYDVARKIVASPSSPQGRTHIILQPNQKEN